MDYNLTIYSGWCVFWSIVSAQDGFAALTILLYQLGYGTPILLYPHKFGSKKEEYCCHCNQPNYNIRFLNDVHLDNLSKYISGVDI